MSKDFDIKKVYTKSLWHCDLGIVSAKEKINQITIGVFPSQQHM